MNSVTGQIFRYKRKENLAERILLLLPDNSREAITIKELYKRLFHEGNFEPVSYSEIAGILESLVGKTFNEYRARLAIKTIIFGNFQFFPSVRFFKSRRLRVVSHSNPDKPITPDAA